MLVANQQLANLPTWQTYAAIRQLANCAPYILVFVSAQQTVALLSHEVFLGIAMSQFGRLWHAMF